MAASAAVPFVSVEEYLHHFPEPDVDYVDGVLEGRLVGEIDHSDVQGALYAIFLANRDSWGIRAYLEARVQVGPTRFRVPDLCILPADWKRTQIVRQPPLLCLEVKSPEFTLARERNRAQDYLRMGVPQVWIFDPATRTAYILRGETMTEQRDGILRLAGTAVEIDLAALFAVLDE